MSFRQHRKNHMEQFLLSGRLRCFVQRTVQRTLQRNGSRLRIEKDVENERHHLALRLLGRQDACEENCRIVVNLKRRTNRDGSERLVTTRKDVSVSLQSCDEFWKKSRNGRKTDYSIRIGNPSSDCLQSLVSPCSASFSLVPPFRPPNQTLINQPRSN